MFTTSSYHYLIITLYSIRYISLTLYKLAQSHCVVELSGRWEHTSWYTALLDYNESANQPINQGQTCFL